ncbi:MAG: preprotein translocase subunit SecG [Armatimonadota bacterium]|nr:preprotein translocase subunit SecG [Armatimonadota bacterium]
MGTFSLFLTIVQFVSALILIVLVMLQTTKSEGLTGTIGGKASATFKGKPGLDEKLSQLTKWSAVSFAITSALLYWISTKAGV